MNFIRIKQLVWLLLGLALMAGLGCAPQMNTTVEAQAAAAQVVEDKYQLGPEDVIEVSVWKQPHQATRSASRRQDHLPPHRRGPGGWQDGETGEEIGERLEKFVTDAQVTVILLKTQNDEIYVVGKVDKAGELVVGGRRGSCGPGHGRGSGPVCLAR